MSISKEYLIKYFTYKDGNLIRNKDFKILGCINTGGYLIAYIFRKQYYIHRLIWLYHYGYLPKEIDHINGIRTDNRIENLREVTTQENARNQKRSSINTSGIIGVSYFNPNKCWIAYITINYKHIHLGYFKNKEDAILARKEAEVEYKFHQNHGRD